MMATLSNYDSNNSKITVMNNNTQVVEIESEKEEKEDKVIETKVEEVIEEKPLTRKELLEIYSNKVYENEPIDINKLKKEDKNLCCYAIQIGWLNYLKETEKITLTEYDKIRAYLMNKYKIKTKINL